MIPPAIRATSVGDGSPNTSELTGPPSAFWRPVGVGRTRMGDASSRMPPPARKLARPSAHETGLSSVTTTAPVMTVPHGRRTRVPPAVEGEGPGAGVTD